MEYFEMKIDTRVTNSIKIQLMDKQYETENEPIYNTNLYHQELVDYIQVNDIYHTAHFLSDKIKKVFEMYHAAICFKSIHIIDKPNSLEKTYWFTDIKETIDIATEKIPKSSGENWILDAAENRSIVKVIFKNRSYILVSLPVAESLLRRLPVGLRLCKVRQA